MNYDAATPDDPEDEDLCGACEGQGFNFLHPDQNPCRACDGTGRRQ